MRRKPPRQVDQLAGPPGAAMSVGHALTVSNARSKVVILGWGSLLWDSDSAFDNQHDDWQYDGPSLPLEFSRISSTRRGALTLVVDQQNGSPATVAWCLSKRRDPDDAVADLMCREGCGIKCISRLNLPFVHSASAAAEAAVIGEWASTRGIDVVIWTGLLTNFGAKRKKPFTVEHAIAYLKTLPPEGKVHAAEYVWRAPEFVTTPLRNALQREPWFSEHPI